MRRTPIAVALSLLLASCSGSDGLVVQTISEYGGTAIANVAVQVNDLPWMTTGPDGRASFGEVAMPYTLRVHQTMPNTAGTKTFHDVWELRGVSESPLVLPVDGTAVPLRRATLGGFVGDRSLAAGTKVAAFAGGRSAVAAADGSFSFDHLAWEGAQSQRMIVRALESDGNDPAQHYIGYGEASIVVNDEMTGAGPNNVSVTLAPVGEAHATGSVMRPAALAALPLFPSLWLEFPDANLGLTEDVTQQDAAFDFLFPEVPGSTAWIRFSVSDPNDPTGAWSSDEIQVDLPASNLQLDLPAPVELIEPATGATIGASTVFRWNAGPSGGVHSLNVICEFDAGNVHYRSVETSGTEATLPAVPGLVVPSGAACAWRVFWSPGSTVGSSGRVSRSASRSVSFQ